MPHCLNCEFPLTNEKFCPKCGQKTKRLDLSFKVIIHDFFANFFNLDAKIWLTIRDIWMPARLPLAFIQGKRNSYYHPIKIFSWILFAFIAVFIFLIKGQLQELQRSNRAFEKAFWLTNLEHRYDDIIERSTLPSDTLLQYKDSLFSIIPTDTFLMSMASGSVDTFSAASDYYNISIPEFSSLTQTLGRDILLLSENEILQKYGQNNIWVGKALVQVQKIVQNLDSSIQFFIGNLTWVIIFVLLAQSFIFRLLYFRKKQKYAEHFLLQLNGITRFILLLILTMTMNSVFNLSLLPWVILAGWVYLYLDLRRFYQQNSILTLLKTLIALGFFFILLLISLIAVLLISAWIL